MSLTKYFLRLVADVGTWSIDVVFLLVLSLSRRSICLAFARQSPGAVDQGLLEEVRGLCGGGGIGGRRHRKVLRGRTRQFGVLLLSVATRLLNKTWTHSY